MSASMQDYTNTTGGSSTMVNINCIPVSKIKFVKTHPDAKLPAKNHPEALTGDAGYDIYCVENVTVPPRGSAIAPVGLKLGYITPGYWFRIEPRSGLGFKKNIQPHLGIIDNPYRGDMGIKLYNFSDVPVTIDKGVAVAQFILYKMNEAVVEWTDVAEQTARGEKGFGSSGV